MGRRKDFRLEGALALVTGAGSGIGREIATLLASHGTRVLAVDIHGDAAEKTAALCAEAGPESHGLTCDVRDPAAVAALAEEVHGTHGTLDILVNNAGVGMTGRLAEMTVEDWEWIRSVNIDGVVHGCLSFGPAMLAKGRGHVVNLSSGLGYTPRATEVAYCATKAAVLSLSQSLRADWGPKGVGVSAVCPGVINTPIIDSSRFVGERALRKDRLVKSFRRGHPPVLVAREAVRAVRENRPVVFPGIEAKVGWYAHRLLPLWGQQLIARAGV